MKVSIITINYNNCTGLEKTINSVINQSFNSLEYLIIDGGSSDESVSIVNTYRKSINYFISEKDSGVYEAMNKGIMASNGDYLLFINSGDVLASPTAIEDAAKYGFDEDLISGNMVYDNMGIKRAWIPNQPLTFNLFYHSGIPHPSTFIKRSLFDTVGLFDTNLKIVSDWKFFILAYCKYNCSFKHIDILISEFSEDGMSSDPANVPKILQERTTVINENFKAFLPDYEELWAAKKQLRKLRYTIKVKKFFGIR